MKFLRAFTLTVILLFPLSSQAETEWWQIDEGWTFWESITLVEGVFTSFSLLSVLDPDITGHLFAWTMPLAVAIGDAGDDTLTTNLIDLAAYESIAFYNMNIDTTKVSQEEIFWSNLLGWHAVLGVSALGHYLFGEDGVLAYVPKKNGSMLYYSYNFKGF